MEFLPTSIDGAYVIDLHRIEDERGFFSRIFCTEEFETAGLSSKVAQANLSHNRHAGTLRGMHYQIAPALETKLVRCVKGSIMDTIVDMRPESSSYLQHYSIELSAENARALFIPSLCAHGFQTLESDTDVLYMVSGIYQPNCESVKHISDKDSQWPAITR